MADSAIAFNERVVETRSGADEVSDFVYNTSHAFPSADVLVPAPMAVAILGQLTLVATATDFKMTKPRDGFRYVHYPDSFRATIMQLVNTGALSLNQSFANFDEINKRCAAIRPGVNNIVQLLVGDERNTARENDLAIQRYLPNQINSLSQTIKACLNKAKETDDTFHQLLELTMEIHESCTATQGENEMRIREANLRQKILDEQKRAAEEMKRLSAEHAKEAREEFHQSQERFNKAAKSMPGGWTIFGLELADCFTSTVGGLANVVTLGLANTGKKSRANINTTLNEASGNPSSRSRPPAEDVSEPGYQKASILRTLADTLSSLLTSGKEGRPDWDAIKATDLKGCTGIKVGFEQVLRDLSGSKKKGGAPTVSAVDFATKGIEYTRRLEGMFPPGHPDGLQKLVEEVSSWRDNVVSFAVQAHLKLGTPLINNNAFMPPPEPDYTGASSAQLAVRSAQYRLAVSSAQLNASRESSKAATEKLMEVTSNLGEILAQVAGINLQVANWEEITAILLRAINFLCQLKMYLNNLVHFFDAMNNLVSVTLQGATQEFIQIVKDSTAIEAPGQTHRTITLDAWARQAIYNHALTAAKISRLVENISGMYVTLYQGNVHPGVNMLLGMGGLVGSNDHLAIAKAGGDIQQWANAASKRITEIVVERMEVNENEIRKRVQELERSLGGILPASPQLDRIVDTAEAKVVSEMVRDAAAEASENPVYKQKNKARLFV
ncbi:hypothetical protein C8Q79DRAFT_140560 [Trametes meyenii]|nr:hypothetical protein C8Q79DRAFT_140560 [Trametes meyenii]